MDVDAVEQWPGNFRHVALNLGGSAMAVARRIAEEAARTGIHGGREHEAGREIHGKSGAGDGDNAVFEGLPEDFENIALEFREFVEKENAIMTERDFAGTRDGAAADEAGVTDGVVGRAIRPRADEAARVVEDSGDAVDARRFDGFFERHRWKNRRNTLGEHRLASAGRADEENVVAAGTSDFERTLCGLLPADVAEIDGILAGFSEKLVRIHGNRGEGFRGIDEIGGLRKRLDREDAHAFHDGGFARVGLRDDKILDTSLTRSQGSRESAADGTDSAIEREFAKKNELIENLAEERALAAEKSERHGKIECGAFLAHVSGSEIDCDSLVARILEAAILKRGLHSLAAFLDGDVRQAYNIENAGFARADVHFDLDEIGVDAIDRRAEAFEEHDERE